MLIRITPPHPMPYESNVLHWKWNILQLPQTTSKSDLRGEERDAEKHRMERKRRAIKVLREIFI